MRHKLVECFGSHQDLVPRSHKRGNDEGMLVAKDASKYLAQMSRIARALAGDHLGYHPDLRNSFLTCFGCEQVAWKWLECANMEPDQWAAHQHELEGTVYD